MLDSPRTWLPPLRAIARVLNALLPEPPPDPLPHSRPREESPIPVTGRPYYLAGITIGSPVSDFGSHAGVKAAVRAAGDATGRDLLETAHYSCFRTISSRIDRTRLRFDGLALERASIEFRPWGWIEQARGADVAAEGRAATVGEDVFLLSARVRNAGAAPVALAPRLEILEEHDPAHESSQPLHLSRGGRTQLEIDERGRGIIDYFRRTLPGPLAFDETRFARAVELQVDGVSKPFFRTWRAGRAFAGDAGALGPGEDREVSFLVGFGETRDEAIAALSRARPLAAVEADWHDFLARAPVPRDATPELRRVVELAATGLRMNVYAPRRRLRGRASMPAKVHFNGFWAWDVPVNALGMREIDLPLAKEILTTLLDGQRANGNIVLATGPDHEAYAGPIEPISQSPVVFLAVDEVLRKDPARDRAWLDAVYPKLERHLDWWETERRDRETGLYCFANAMESGWDDTPRIPNPRVEKIRFLNLDLGNLSGLEPADRIANVDLNGWVYLALECMAGFARRLGRAGEPERFEARARDLAAAVERHLWDEDAGAWFDRDLARGRAIRVMTPAIAWPLFAGMARDPERVRRVVERHLLDPKKFFGPYPVPSVALDDPAYDRAQRGYYWRGQIWMIPCFVVLTGLFRYGYEAEAREMRARILRMLAGACEGGLFETYDAETGEVGFGSGCLSGAGEPAAFQIGLTTSLAIEIALSRHERRRFLKPGERAFDGRVEEARDLATGAVLYRVIDPAGDPPRASVSLEGDAVEVVLDAPATVEVRGERRAVAAGERARFG